MELLGVEIDLFVGYCCWVFGKNCGLVYIVLFEVYILIVFEVDGWN